MRTVVIVLGITSLLFLVFIIACVQVAGQEDEWEEQYMDADWVPAEDL